MNNEKKKTLIKILLAVVLAIFVIFKVDWAYLPAMGTRLSWGWAFLSLLFVILMTVLKAWQYQVLIAKGLKFLDVLKTVVWQNTITNFVANSAGVVSYMTLLKTEQNIKLTRSGVVFLMTKLGDLLAICFYLVISTALTWDEITVLHEVTLLLIFGILGGFVLILVTIWWRERFVDALLRLTAWLRLDRLSPVKKGDEILRSLAKEDRAAIFAMLRNGILLSLVYMTATMLYTWANIKIFDIQIGVMPVIYVAAMRQLISYVPLQVLGGLGIAEVTSVYLYGVFGLDQGEMSAVMLGLRVIFYLRHAIVFLYIPFEAFIQKRRYEGFTS